MTRTPYAGPASGRWRDLPNKWGKMTYALPEPLSCGIAVGCGGKRRAPWRSRSTARDFDLEREGTVRHLSRTSFRSRVFSCVESR